MSQKCTSTTPLVRPYWAPQGLNFSKLPAAARLALESIVAPTYSELVLGAADALERSAGITLAFLLALEVVEQFELGETMVPGASADPSGAADRDRQIGRLLRIVSAKQNATKFLTRLREIRAQRELALGPLGLDPSLANHPK